MRSHYDILDIPDWPLLLALALARDFVPGFKVKRSKRGPRVWDAKKYMTLIADVEAIKRENECGDREACRILIMRSKKIDGLYKRTKKATIEAAMRSLEARLVEARQQKHNVLAYFLDAAADNLDKRERALQSVIDHFSSKQLRPSEPEKKVPRNSELLT